jgi:N-methylhydantoinase A
MQLPVVDLLEVGSGGGSIARLDETGLLKVGPVSAGASPGPVCYGRGGDQPTVTDADLVLGRLNGDFFLGGEMKLDVEAAKEAITRVVAKPLNLDPIRAAFGICRVTDADMAHAVRIMTVQKGHDPRDFVLVAYGGAGPSHAVTVARDLGIRRVVIPPHPGIFSAIGMLLADAREEHVLSYVRPLSYVDPVELEAKFVETEERGIKTMTESGFAASEIVTSRSVEMRYVGQEFTLVLDVPNGHFTPQDLQQIHRQFDDLHEARYGHAFRNVQPEIVSLRAHIVGLLAKPELSLAAPAQQASGKPIGQRPVYFDEVGFVTCNVFRREDIALTTVIQGPAIIEEVMSTTTVHPGDECRVDEIGNLVIDIAE